MTKRSARSSDVKLGLAPPSIPLSNAGCATVRAPFDGWLCGLFEPNILPNLHKFMKDDKVQPPAALLPSRMVESFCTLAQSETHSFDSLNIFILWEPNLGTTRNQIFVVFNLISWTKTDRARERKRDETEKNALYIYPFVAFTIYSVG